MHSSDLYSLIALLAATASAQSTATATVLVPDRCVTQATPTVTVLGQGDVTTYSYLCSTDSAAVSSASAHVSSLYESAKSRASDVWSSWENDARVTGRAGDENDNDRPRRRSLNTFNFKKRDDTCYGWDASGDACVPWEVTQGPSTWAVHYSATGSVGLDQECSFGDGGVASGPATCTASGRLDPSVWGAGDASRTRTFQKSDVDQFWIRNTVAVTSGSGPATTGTVSTSGTRSATSSTGAQSTGLGVSVSVPTAAVVVMAGAGGVLVAALAL